MRSLFAAAATLFAAASMISSALAAPKKRPLAPADVNLIADVSEPELSPDGNWVAYTVSRHDPVEDEVNDDIWITAWDGSTSVRMTTSKKSESGPKFSPDGARLAFISDRDSEDELAQIYVISRTGGEAEAVTTLAGELEDYAWSPDGKKMVVVMKDPDPNAVTAADKDKKKTLAPIVLDRFQFKEDKVGYLDQRRSHLYLLDLTSRQLEPLTTGLYNELLPAWSPDGRRLVFASKRGKDFDRDDNWDLYVIEAKAKSTARKLTSFTGADLSPEWESSPAWSPDGKTVAYLRAGPQELIYYAMHRLAVVPGAGGEEKYLSPSIDNNFYAPKYSPDGAAIYFLLEADRSTVLGKISAQGGEWTNVLAETTGSISAYDVAANDRLVVLQQSPKSPSEVYAVENGKLRPLSRQNETLFAQLELGAVEETSFPSKDGTEVHGFLIKPPGYKADKKYPTILRIHGGPVSQFERELRLDLHVLAAHGYVVLAVNPRGSSGRGEAYSKAIYADWGNKDGDDVLAAVDDAVKRGIADPNRLGIGGWSYGGILTNYVIARDTRFKAAISGAGIANVVAGYGTDMYVREYEYELGQPWKNTEVWLRLSSPFFHADRIVTPTLFICGEKDFNVPLLNSEQMYQALRSLGIDTRLVIYPGEAHDIKKPSYLRDRLERYLAWYDKYLLAPAAAPSSARSK